MPYYRIYQYDNGDVPFKHVYIKRERGRVFVNEDGHKKTKHGSKWEENVSRAKSAILSLALCNEWEYFCTFTFNPVKFDRRDLKKCFSSLSKFFNNYKSRFSHDFAYLVVPEQHKDGSYHFHGLARGFGGDLVVPKRILKRNLYGELVEVPNTKGYYKWLSYDKNMGIFNCSPIFSPSGSAFYITKYVTKDMQNIPDGTHLYAASKGLKRPKLIYDEDDVPMSMSPTYENDYVAIAYEHVEDTQQQLAITGHELTPFGVGKTVQYESQKGVCDIKRNSNCLVQNRKGDGNNSEGSEPFEQLSIGL